MYGRSSLDEDLVSGFLSAIISLSQELAIGKINVMDMKQSKFIYETRTPFIFILNLTPDIDFQFGKSLITEITQAFKLVYDKFDETVKSDKNLIVNALKTSDFKLILDNLVNVTLTRYYRKKPMLILNEFESYLKSLLGSLGESIMESSIASVCDQKQNFKTDQLRELISTIELSLKKTISDSQVKVIIQPLEGVLFLEDK